jgi:hypothetical protein
LQVVHIHLTDNSTDNTYLLVISDTDVKQLRFTSPLLGVFTTGDKVAITYNPADDAVGERACCTMLSCCVQQLLSRHQRTCSKAVCLPPNCCAF